MIFPAVMTYWSVWNTFPIGIEPSNSRCLRFKAIPQARSNCHRMDQDQGESTVSTNSLILVQELHKAESEIIKLVQRTAFAAEMKVSTTKFGTYQCW